MHHELYIPFFYAGFDHYCTGEAIVCEAVSSWNLTLNCSSCSSANGVSWKFGGEQLLPYNTFVAQIPAKDVEPSATGCYTCVCGGKSYSFTVDIRAAGKPTHKLRP